MIKIISPDQFKTIPWKNGLGETTELAISESGSLDCFDWRLSIASVVADGVFSDFSGYNRNLVLIEGNGICLTHNDNQVDELHTLLDVANFSGSCTTVGTLTKGAIKDFNIITNQQTILPKVQCITHHQEIEIKLSDNQLCFAYSLSDEIKVNPTLIDNFVVPKGSLLQLGYTSAKEPNEYLLCSSNMIIVKLSKC